MQNTQKNALSNTFILDAYRVSQNKSQHKDFSFFVVHNFISILPNGLKFGTNFKFLLRVQNFSPFSQIEKKIVTRSISLKSNTEFLMLWFFGTPPVQFFLQTTTTNPKLVCLGVRFLFFVLLYFVARIILLICTLMYCPIMSIYENKPISMQKRKDIL